MYMSDLPPSSTTVKVIDGDPIHVQQHTLQNGLNLFMSVNKDEPRIYTEIAVRAGSKHDPADTTGLAHYFEHMMFKGTDRIGTLNWEKEKELLDQIEELFEVHRAEQDPEKKKELYARIDKLSYEAARYAATNEYDKMASAIGAKGTNAYTWVEQTVYVDDIPTNELERWFELESERFRRPILRLFHTELETVFEEYNISQDRDVRKVIKAMQEVLTPTHPYGTQTTLGRGEDLKNPSQKNIYRFFDQYYVPNNIGIILCGDFEPEQAIHLAEKNFGHFEFREVPKFHFDPQPEVPSRVQKDVYGNEAEWIELGWRFDGANSRDAAILPVISGLLYNQQAGLMDLNLIQKQELLEAWAYPRIYEDYSSLVVYAKPREGQSLEAVEQLLLEQVQLLREGKFEDWLPQAVVKDLKLSEMKAYEKNKGRAGSITNAFILGIPWQEMVERWEWLEKLEKSELLDIISRTLREDNFVAVYKHSGPDPHLMKVEKPQITPIEVNRNDSSDFAREFYNKQTPDITPEFVQYNKLIDKASILPNVKLEAVTQEDSGLFHVHYLYEMGTASDAKLPLATTLLSYLGTSSKSSEELQKAFYRLGVHYTTTCREDHLYLSLSGLSESFEEAVELFESFLADVQSDQAAYDNLVADILLKRVNNKKDKQVVLSKALANYAKHGEQSGFTDILKEEELLAMDPAELTGLIRSLNNFKHEIYYYGPLSARKAANVLAKYHKAPESLQAPIKPKSYPEPAQRSNKVYFVHFPMVQVELLLMSRGSKKFNLDEFIMSEWYNQYFGYGLSSIVFQEIRESKALAYAAYAYSGNPNRKNRAHFLQAYVGTQPDKLQEAVEAFQLIMEDMPISEEQIENARKGVLKQIAASRITHSDLFWTRRANKLRGYKDDIRKEVFERLKDADQNALIEYHDQYIRGRNYNWMVLGDRDRIDFRYLRSIGKVEELSLETIFGY